MFDALTCDAHGWRTHAMWHEAAHAVLAVDYDIDFVGITVRGPGSWDRYDDTTFIAGYLDLGDRDNIRSHPRETLEVCLAGAATEEVVLGHYMRDAWRADIELWRGSMGFTDAGWMEATKDALGVTVDQVIATVHEWVLNNQRRILCVGRALFGLSADSSGAFLVGDDTTWTLSRDEVLDALSALT